MPNDLRYAVCDCAVEAPCGHVILAVAAFRLLAPDATTELISTASVTPPAPTALIDEIEQELIEEGMRLEARNRQLHKELEIEALRRKIANEITDGAVQLKLIESLPAIAEKLPKPDELKTLSIGGQDALAGLVGGLLRMLEALRAPKA